MLGNHDYLGDTLLQIGDTLTLKDKRWFCQRSYQLKYSLCGPSHQGNLLIHCAFEFLITSVFRTWALWRVISCCCRSLCKIRRDFLHWYNAVRGQVLGPRSETDIRLERSWASTGVSWYPTSGNYSFNSIAILMCHYRWNCEVQVIVIFRAKSQLLSYSTVL